MIITRRCMFSAFACLWLGCGGDDVTSPREASAEVVDAICDWIEECGEWEFECSEDGLDCTGTLVQPSRAECVAERELDDLIDADCPDLTADQQDLVGACVDGLAARACITQAEVDAYLEALENGEEPAEPGEPAPEACDQLGDVFEDCLDGQ